MQWKLSKLPLLALQCRVYRVYIYLYITKQWLLACCFRCNCAARCVAETVAATATKSATIANFVCCAQKKKRIQPNRYAKAWLNGGWLPIVVCLCLSTCARLSLHSMLPSTFYNCCHMLWISMNGTQRPILESTRLESTQRRCYIIVDVCDVNLLRFRFPVRKTLTFAGSPCQAGEAMLQRGSSRNCSEKKFPYDNIYSLEYAHNSSV